MSLHALKQLTADHYEALWRLFLVVFPIKYKNEFLDAWLEREPSLSFGAFADTGELVGFIIVSQKESGPAATAAPHLMIEFLGVAPSAQKAGIGTLLLQHILDYCNRTQTRVMLIPVNEPRVICWYKKHGFSEYGEPRISPYTGELEQRMELLLRPSAAPIL